MRYFFDRGTLFIRGRFRAAGTTLPDGIATVSSLLATTVDPASPPGSPAKELELAAAGAGIWRDFTGFTTTVPVRNVCVFQCDFLTCFILAEIRTGRRRGHGGGRTDIIICSSKGLSDTALQEAVNTSRDTVMKLLAEGKRERAGRSLGSLIVACEGRQDYSAAGPENSFGSRIQDLLLFGLPETIRRAGKGGQKSPPFFIFSRLKGGHWIEWTPKRCPYYPCHFEGQRCDYCYCPLYPCGEESLGQWTESSNGARVWNCAGCTMIHEPAVADHLKRYPEATVAELIRVSKKDKR